MTARQTPQTNDTVDPSERGEERGNEYLLPSNESSTRVAVSPELSEMMSGRQLPSL